VSQQARPFFSRPLSILVSLLMILVGCLVANGVQTNGGKVKIQDLRFSGINGGVVSALLYTPANMEKGKTYPAVETIHGYINSREVQDAFDIEFARRGYVVLSIDMEGHGYSDQKGNPDRGALSGLVYLRNLPFVDKDNIALEGHSMGGWSAAIAALEKPEWVRTLIQVGSSTGGNVIKLTPPITPDTPFNYGLIYSQYDEFSDLMWEIPHAKDINNTQRLQDTFGTSGPVEANKVYGSFENKTARELYQPPVIHPGDHWSTAAVGDAIDFLQKSMAAPNPISPDNQVWRWKEFGTFFAMIGAVLFLFALAGNLLKTPFFASVSTPMPEARGYKSRGAWWVAAIIGTAIPAITFFKFQEWGSKWFPASALFPQNLTTGIAVWDILNAIIALVLFWVFHRTNEGANAYHYGVSYDSASFRLNWRSIGKAALLALTVVGSVYLLTLIIGAVFNLDFRIWVIGLKKMSWHQFTIFLVYLIPFLVYYLVNSLILHAQLRPKAGETERKTAWKWFGASFFVNTVGIIVLILLQYIPLFVRDQLLWHGVGADASGPLLGIVAFQFVPVNLVASAISTYFFRKTGKIYAGAFVNALLITWYIVAGQAIQFAS
jgi:pimeloyl-ACP methyl ester carboxylesterase